MQKGRVFRALVGVIVLLFAGFVYAWSILSAPIAADFPLWSRAQLSLTFTLCMAFFCLGGVLAGLLSAHISVRVTMLLSAALFLGGFLLAARAQTLAALYIGYGLLCGTASGFAYNSVMNVIPPWFPERQGLISGVLLMGFGAGSMVIGAAFSAFTPPTPGAWRTSLVVMGILMAAVLVAGSFFFTLPGQGQVPAPSKPQTDGDGPEFSPLSMLRHPSFWWFFLWATLLSAIGLVIIAQGRTLALTAAPRLSPRALSLTVGLISVCNGLGRVFFGVLFDKIGRRSTMLLVTGAMLGGTLLLAAAFSTGSVALLVAGFVCIGMGYGGGPTMGAAVTRSFYGQRHYAVNFSLINLNLLLASASGTLAAALLDAGGSFTGIFAALLAMAGCALLSVGMLKDP